MEEEHVEDEKSNINNDVGSLKIKHSILDNFRKLTKIKEKVRIKASTSLVNYLIENQKNETEFKYALGRIIRGLGSSTVSAKSGFYATLMPLINFSDITVEQIFEFVEKELHTGTGNSKSENADVSMGIILVCTAIVRSGLFMKSSDEDKKKIIECILHAGNERSYLMYPEIELLLEIDEKINKDIFQYLLLPITKPLIEKPFSDYTLDTFYYLIVLTNKYPKLIGREILKKIANSSTWITESNLESFSNILMTIPRITSIKHPVYELFGKMLVKTQFTIPFIHLMDKALLKYNRNKHLIIINFLTILLKHIENQNDLPHLLEENFIQQTIKVFRQLRGIEKDYELKEFTHNLFESLVEALKKENVDDQTKISILKKLLFYPGTFIFEKITKSKVIQHITLTLKNEGVKELAAIYKEVVMLENEKFNLNTSELLQKNDRLYAANLLVKLMCHPSVHEENKWKCEQLKFLMSLGLLKQPQVEDELASSLKETFFRSLDLKLSKLEDLRIILFEVFNELDSYLTKNLEMRSDLTEEISETWSKAKEIINKIQSKKTKKIKLVFEILFLHLGLQLFNDVKLAKDSLEELFSCYERMKKKNNSETDPAWIEVVVEVFLSLLSHNSYLLRKMVNCVFPHLCEYLNASAIHQIISVLDPNSEDNPLTYNGDASDEDLSEDEEDSDNEEEEECVEEEEQNDDDDDCSEEEEEAVDETKTDKLRKALQIALTQNMDNGDESDIDLDQIDDEQGEKLNQVLGQVFKEFRSNFRKHKKQSKNDEITTHFRIRVLDLIEIYIDSSPSMISTLEIMVSLLHLLEFSIKDTHQKPLQDRVRHCLRKMSALKKFSDIAEVSDNTLCEFLENLLEKETRTSVILQMMGNEIAQCCVFIINCSKILVNDENTPKKMKKHLNQNITNIITSSLNNYLTKRNCHLPNVIFKQILQFNWNGNIELMKFLLPVIFDENIKPFKKNEAVDWIKICYSNHRLLLTCENELKEDFEKITEEFLDKCLQFFKNLIEISDNNVREKFLSFLFQLLATIKQSPLQIKTFDWTCLGDKIREYRNCTKINPDTKKSYNKLLVQLGISNKIETKPSVIEFSDKDKKYSETNGDCRIEVNSKKRKMLNHESKKKKKLKT